MVFTVNSFTVLGVDGTTVKVEVDSGTILPGISIVPVTFSAVKESRE